MRRTDLDVLRVIAIMLVLLNHLPAYTMYYKGDGFAEIGYMLTALITRINVPLFAMVSGVLLLEREESIMKIWRKRILRIALVLVISQISLYAQRQFINDQPLEWGKFVKGMLSGEREGYIPYWFLYAYIGFLMILPYLRRIAQKMTRNDFWYLLGLHFILTSVPPIINFILKNADCEPITLSKHFYVPVACTTMIFYPLMGYYLDKKVNFSTLSREKWIWLIGSTLMGLLVCGTMTYHQGKHAAFSQDYLNTFAYLTTFCTFILVKYFHERSSAHHLGGLFRFSGPLCFGIYLIDNNLKDAFWTPFAQELSPYCSQYVMSLLWILGSIIVGGTLTWILRKLPCIKALL